MPKSVHILGMHYLEAHLGVRIEEHAPKCHRVHTKECAPSRRVHLMPRSMHNPDSRAPLKCAQLRNEPRGTCQGTYDKTLRGTN